MQSGRQTEIQFPPFAKAQPITERWWLRLRELKHSIQRDRPSSAHPDPDVPWPTRHRVTHEPFTSNPIVRRGLRVRYIKELTADSDPRRGRAGLRINPNNYRRISLMPWSDESQASRELLSLWNNFVEFSNRR
ncbi:hypothetical protein J6590_040241 [Homalodisca vitripennis]|nr:hypothetical protein J6590_040241 [Homalodisca vitripennis]